MFKNFVKLGFAKSGKIFAFLMSAVVFVTSVVPCLSASAYDSSGSTVAEKGSFVQGEILFRKKGQALASGYCSTMSEIDSEYNLYDVEKINTSALDSAKSRSDKCSVCSASDDSLYKAKVKGDVLDTCKKLSQRPDIEFAEPDYIYKTDSAVPEEITPAGDYYSQTIGYMNSAGIPSVWTNQQTYGAGVTVAVIDTGINASHIEFSGRLWDDGSGHNGWNAYSDNYDLTDQNGHGTNVAGIIAMDANNGGGVGVAPQAKIMVCKASNGDSLACDDIVECINYAVSHHADIISMSFGSYDKSTALTEAVQSASNSALLVAAAGNDCNSAESKLCYPAAESCVLGVMSYGSDVNGTLTYGGDERLSPFSNYDTTMRYYEVAAPGYDIIGPDFTSNYDYVEMCGTSQATPIVSAAAALYLSKYPSTTPNQLFGKIVQSSDRYVKGDSSSANMFANASVPSTSVSLNCCSRTIRVNDAFTLSASMQPQNTTDKITWSSSNSGVASVSGGTVIGRSAGTVRITARTSSGKTASCTVTVKPVPTYIHLNMYSKTLGIGEKCYLRYYINPGAVGYVTWRSSNPRVASVNSNGTVTALRRGTAVITARTYNGKACSCRITVKYAPRYVKLSRTSKTIYVRRSYKLKTYLSSGSYSDLSWRSSNTRVAVVSGSGTVTAKKRGRATITVRTYNGRYRTCRITVR